MSTIGSNPLQESYMIISTLGKTTITVTPLSKTPEILKVDIGSDQRKEPISMETKKDETIDQFCLRLRGMLRAMMNGEPKPEPKAKNA